MNNSMIRIRALLLDVLAIVVFVWVGRSVHGHRDTIGGIIATGLPFFTGTVVGWVISRAWQKPKEFFPTGVVIWLSTVAVGQVLRLVVGQGSAVAFVLVSLGFFALTMLGWRALSLLVDRRILMFRDAGSR